MQMIVEPDQRVADFAKAGADIISVHVESKATTHLDRVIHQVMLSVRLVGLYDDHLPWRLLQLMHSVRSSGAALCLMLLSRADYRSRTWAARRVWC